MSAVTLWLLVSYGWLGGTGSGAPGFVVVERFITGTECERVRDILIHTDTAPSRLRCVQATVAGRTQGG